MKKTLATTAVLAAAALVLASLSALPAKGDGEPAGQTLFLDIKCNMCHAVPAAEIEAKTKSDKLKGPDLGGPIKADPEAVAAYLRKEGELDGKTHKKAVDISTEDVKTILDWLGSLEAPAGGE